MTELSFVRSAAAGGDIFGLSARPVANDLLAWDGECVAYDLQLHRYQIADPRDEQSVYVRGAFKQPLWSYFIRVWELNPGGREYAVERAGCAFGDCERSGYRQPRVKLVQIDAVPMEEESQILAYRWARWTAMAVPPPRYAADGTTGAMASHVDAVSGGRVPPPPAVYPPALLYDVFLPGNPGTGAPQHAQAPQDTPVPPGDGQSPADARTAR